MKLCVLFVFLSCYLFAQDRFEEIDKSLLNMNFTAARAEMKNIPDSLRDEYYECLSNIINGDFSYDDLALFNENVFSVDYILVYNFVMPRIIEPSINENIDLAYLNLLLDIHYMLSQDYHFEKMKALENKFQQYFSAYSSEDSDYLEAKYLLNTLYAFQVLTDANSDYIISLAAENIALARAFNDTLFILEALYLYTGSVAFSGGISGVRDSLYVGLHLSQLLNPVPEYYFIFSGDICLLNIENEENQEETYNALFEIYNSEYKFNSFEPYLAFLIGTEESVADSVFNIFGVQSYESLCDTILEMIAKIPEYRSVERLNTSIGCEALLFDKKRYEAAHEYSIKNFESLKTILSDDLSQAIADEKLRYIKVKHLEQTKSDRLLLETERRAYFYLLLSFFTILIFTILFIVYFFKLKSKNKILAKTQKHKEILLLEIHHRVKNNFQIVSSLMEIQTRGVTDPKAKKMALDGQIRIHTMSLIHQQLYDSDDLGLCLHDFVKSLISQSMSMYKTEHVNVDIDIDPLLLLNMEVSIPLGLILNELITNSYKYTFSKKTENAHLLELNLQSDGAFHKLILSDNGVGLPIDFNYKATKSIGFGLISSLAKQLKGSFEYSFEGKPIYCITFPK